MLNRHVHPEAGAVGVVNAVEIAARYGEKTSLLGEGEQIGPRCLSIWFVKDLQSRAASKRSIVVRLSRG
jgi:hypothetical protein